jgi:phage terminase large subunit-like protein
MRKTLTRSSWPSCSWCGRGEVVYDPFLGSGTTLIAAEQTDRVLWNRDRLVEFPMTVQRYSGPMKEVEADIISGKLRHSGDPVLGWMMGNVVARKDAKDNVFPRKTRDEHKIDAAVGVIAARGRSMADQPVPSVYETRGILML